jgi:mono/diheme cytochrome c family protein
MVLTAPESRRRGGDGGPPALAGEARQRRSAIGEAAIDRSATGGPRAAASLAVALAGMWVAGATVASAQQSVATAAPDGGGWYTPAQATSGQQLFNNYCAECHRPDLTGADGPALKGAAFLKTFGGQPLSDLYGVEHTTMPAVNPGSLPDTTLLPITAFILSQNGLPAGDTPLDQTALSRTLPAAP